MARYKKERDEITDEVKQLEAERYAAQVFNNKFGQTTIFLQIVILMSSLASINKVRYYWYFSLASGGTGVLMFLNTLYLSL